MTTSLTSSPFEVTGDHEISKNTLHYIRIRNRQRAFDLVIKEFKKSGITQATLARRLGKKPEIISRLLARPNNWEIDTFSDLMFAISGGVARYQVDYPISTSRAQNVVRFCPPEIMVVAG